MLTYQNNHLPIIIIYCIRFSKGSRYTPLTSYILTLTFFYFDFTWIKKCQKYIYIFILKESLVLNEFIFNNELIVKYYYFGWWVLNWYFQFFISTLITILCFTNTIRSDNLCLFLYYKMKSTTNGCTKIWGEIKLCLFFLIV